MQSGGQIRPKNGGRSTPTRLLGGQQSGRPEAGSSETVRPGTTRMFASVVPGMATLVSRQLDQLPGVRVTDAGFDGRSDLVLFEVDRGRRDTLWKLRTIEDPFVEVGRTMRSSGDRPPWIAGRIWRPERVEKALSVWSAEVRPLAGTMAYRVIARVLQERSFLRTELRKSLTQAISIDKPKWRIARSCTDRGLGKRVPARPSGGWPPPVRRIDPAARRAGRRAPWRIAACARGDDG